ncbi:MAG TPA: pirin family protein [Actinomycetota bacterium]|nr:pirin family protein [Actinomycetota bacterium]
METATAIDAQAIVLTPDDYTILTEEDFGSPGVQATEMIGSFVRLQASGPLLAVHDSTWQPRLGVGHHPHRYNERLFYILEGEVDHDDSLNRITGHMGTGDLGRLTEGRGGMWHSEWNNTDGGARAFILVYPTDPMPARASFAALRDGDAPRYDEGHGVKTKELVGPRSPLEIHGDIRLFADSEMAPGAALDLELQGGEGLLLTPLEGDAVVEGTPLPARHALVIAPGDQSRAFQAIARSDSRVLRVVHGPGEGLVLGEPMMTRTQQMRAMTGRTS